MAWTIELSKQAERELARLDRPAGQRVVAYLRQLVSETEHPNQRGKGLIGPLRGLWRYRVGDYRLICQLLNDRLVVLVLRIGHRSEIYDR